MNEKIKTIKFLLDELQDKVSSSSNKEFTQNFNALEIPALVSSIVRYLQPSLTPYEIAIYWYLFEVSVIQTGDQFTRASTRGLSQIAKSASGQSDRMSYGVIQRTLNSLQEKGVISVVGDTTRDGTPYKIHIPDEIEICKEAMASASQQVVQKIDTAKELDYYNVKENRLKVFQRDEYKCHYCTKQLTRFSATLDHIQPVSRGGDNSFENLVTACLHCNAERGNKPVSEFIADS